MRIHLELTVESPRLSRPRRPRTLVALGAVVVALLLPAVVLANHTFADVPASHTFHTNIANLAGAGVTAGCGAGIYCPDQPVTRGQMAGFLNRGLGRVAEADVSTIVTGTPDASVGALTITPGTSPGALPGARQFVRAQFNGVILFSNATSCPCRVVVQALADGSALDSNAIAVTVTSAGTSAPISTGGVIVVTGSDPVTISVHAQIFPGGGSTASYTVYGNLVAETIPFGSTGTGAP